MFVLALSLATLCSAEAQYMKVYNPGDGSSTYSLRGYDLVSKNGKLYYFTGNEEKKVIFEIDPSTGDIVNPSTKVAELNLLGSRTGLGKNSASNMLQVGFENTFQTHITPFRGMYISDQGTYFNENERISVPAQIPTYPGSNQANTWFHNSDFADQVQGGSNVYAVGQLKMNPYHDDNQMFILKHDDFGIPAPVVKKIYYTNYDRDYPTRIIEEANTGIFTSFGGNLHDGTNYITNPLRMDPGLWVVDHDLNTKVFKTYHNYSDHYDNLGVAQSVIKVNSLPIPYNGVCVLVASGDNPKNENPNNDQFEMGHWDKPHFHLLIDQWKDSRFPVTGYRYSFPAPIIEDPYQFISYENVQVGDIVEIDDGFLVTGSLSMRINSNDGQIMFWQDLEKVFVLKLNTNFEVELAKIFHGLPINPASIEELQANRIKVINDEVFVVGSYARNDIANQRTPFLIKTDFDLKSFCGQEIDAYRESVDVSAYHPFVDDYDETPTTNELGQNDPVVIVADELVECEEEFNGNGEPHDGNTWSSGAFEGNDPWESARMEASATANDERIDEAAIHQFSISPNPAVDIIQIKGLSEGNANIAIFDLTGKEIMTVQFTVAGDVSKINVQELKTGVYMARVVQGDQLKTIKLMKE